MRKMRTLEVTILLLLLTFINIVTPDIQADLVVELLFESDLSDTSNNGNSPSSITSGTIGVYISAYLGRTAATFDGISYLDFGVVPSIPSSNSNRSTCFWASPTGFFDPVVGTGKDGAGKFDIILNLNNVQVAYDPVSISSTGWRVVNSAWNYICVTYSPDIIKIYYGNETATAILLSTQDVTGITNTKSGESSYVGKNADSNNDRFRGYIDDLRIYARELSLNDIQQLQFTTSRIIDSPTSQPSSQPSAQPSVSPTLAPTGEPSAQPTNMPSMQPSSDPSVTPTAQPTAQPTVYPTSSPSSTPSAQPSSMPSGSPSVQPSLQPFSTPSSVPTGTPTVQPTSSPSTSPTVVPSSQPSTQPTSIPTGAPSILIDVYSDLVAEFLFEGSFQDSSNSANDASSVSVGSADVLLATYLDRNSGYFDGSNYLTLGLSNSIPSGNSNRTFCFWVSPASSAAPVIGTGRDGEGKFDIVLIDADVYVLYTSSSAGTNVGIVRNEWNYVCIGYALEFLYIFAGDEATEVSFIGAISVNGIADTKASEATYIGKTADPGNSYFSGYLDDVRIYNRLLNIHEVRILQNTTTRLIDSPTGQPSQQPSSLPSAQPTSQPTCPTSQPSTQPSAAPTGQPDIDWAVSNDVPDESFTYLSVSFSSDGNVVAVGQKSSSATIIRSTDGGSTWTTSSYGMKPPFA